MEWYYWWAIVKILHLSKKWKTFFSNVYYCFGINHMIFILFYVLLYITYVCLTRTLFFQQWWSAIQIEIIIYNYYYAKNHSLINKKITIKCRNLIKWPFLLNSLLFIFQLFHVFPNVYIRIQWINPLLSLSWSLFFKGRLFQRIRLSNNLSFVQQR